MKFWNLKIWNSRFLLKSKILLTYFTSFRPFILSLGFVSFRRLEFHFSIFPIVLTNFPQSRILNLACLFIYLFFRSKHIYEVNQLIILFLKDGLEKGEEREKERGGREKEGERKRESKGERKKERRILKELIQ